MGLHSRNAASSAMPPWPALDPDAIPASRRDRSERRPCPADRTAVLIPLNCLVAEGAILAAHRDRGYVMTTNPENWQPHSLASDWEAAMFTPFPLARTMGELMGMGKTPTMLATSAQLQVMAVETATVYLEAARHFVDLWRTSIRDHQDALLEGWADQAGRMFAEASAGGHAAPLAASHGESGPTAQSRKPLILKNAA